MRVRACPFLVVPGEGGGSALEERDDLAVPLPLALHNLPMQRAERLVPGGLRLRQGARHRHVTIPPFVRPCLTSHYDLVPKFSQLFRPSHGTPSNLYDRRWK